jgi:hypothetical protein
MNYCKICGVELEQLITDENNYRDCLCYKCVLTLNVETMQIDEVNDR